MTVSAAILAIIMTTIGGFASTMRLHLTGGDRESHEHGERIMARFHQATMGRNCQKTIKYADAKTAWVISADVDVRNQSKLRIDFRPKNGAEYPTRTDDLPLTRRLLYQLS